MLPPQTLSMEESAGKNELANSRSFLQISKGPEPLREMAPDMTISGQNISDQYRLSLSCFPVSLKVLTMSLHSPTPCSLVEEGAEDPESTLLLVFGVVEMAEGSTSVCTIWQTAPKGAPLLPLLFIPNTPYSHCVIWEHLHMAWLRVEVLEVGTWRQKWKGWTWQEKWKHSPLSCDCPIDHIDPVEQSYILA